MLLLALSCDPDSSSSKATPPRFTLTPNNGGTTFTLTIGEGVKTIARGEFAAVPSLGTGADKIDFDTRLAGKLGANPEKTVTAIVLPSTLETIGDYAFIYHRNVQGFTLPKQVRTIGKSSFEFLSSSLFRSRSVIEFEEPSQLTNIGESAFRQAYSNVLKLPESLETIGRGAFFDWKGLSATNTFTIPANVKSIDIAALVNTVRHSIRGTLTIASPHLVRTPADTTQSMAGNLNKNLFVFANLSMRSNFSTIKLHQAVYDSYTKADLKAIFGTGTIAYQKLDGTSLTPK